MQTVDVDYVIQAPEGSKGGLKSAVIRMYGITEKGNSVLAFIHGFEPYFYVPCWPGFEQRDVQQFGEALDVGFDTEREEEEEGMLRGGEDAK